MVTVRSRAVSGPGEQQLSVRSPKRRCVYCRREIVWMRTYIDGRRFAFNAAPVPRHLDDGTGWVPGPFPVKGRPTTVLAPLTLHPGPKRRRVQFVMHLHQCRGHKEKVQVA